MRAQRELWKLREYIKKSNFTSNVKHRERTQEHAFVEDFQNVLKDALQEDTGRNS